MIRKPRRFASAVGIWAGALLGGFACATDDGPVDPGDDTTAPAVNSTSPNSGATSVSVASVVSATFSEPIDVSTISPTTISLNNGVTGQVSYSGLTHTFTPDVNLSFSTQYTATVSTGIADVAGNPLSASHSWSFTTEVSPIPPAGMPLMADKKWLYDVDWTRTVVGSSIGVRTTTFVGQLVLHVEQGLTWQGRTAWRLLRYDLEDIPNQNPFNVEVIYLSQVSDGLDKWVPTGTGGEWRRIFSTQVASFQNNAFLLAGSPRGPTTILSQAQVTVPAGTYTTVRANVNFTVTGQNVPEDIFENRSEYYADGVGNVAATWSFDFDDNDPAAFDVFEDGLIELKNIDTGPFPNIVADAEPNDNHTPAGSQAISPYSIGAGGVAITDPGAIVTDPNVSANINGEQLLQDWYRFTTMSTGPLRLDMVFEVRTNGVLNDLDVYFFQEGSTGLTYLAAGLNPAGQSEVINFASLPAGTYYVGVQAWDTPTGNVGYWFLIR